MTRHSRQFSSTGVYHIIIKGIDSQDIFYEDSDRIIFLNYTTFQEKLLDALANQYDELINYAELELIEKLSDNDLIYIIMKRFNISSESDIPT